MALLKLATNLILKLVGITFLVYAVLFLTPGTVKMKVIQTEGEVQIFRKTNELEKAAIGRELYTGDGIETDQGKAKLMFQIGNRESVTVKPGERYEVGDFSALLSCYLHWIKGLLHGDMGHHLSESVTERLVTHTPRTLLLVFGSLIISLITSLGLALLSIRLAGNALVRHVIALFNLLSGIHIIVISFAVIIAGWVLPNRGFSIWMLVILALGNGTLVDYFVILREQIACALHQDYVSAAQGRGASPLRHAMLYEITLGLIEATSSRIPALVGGTIILEWIFSYIGLGFDIVKAVQVRSFELIMGVTTVIATLLILVTEVTDALRRRLDPRLGH